MFGIGGVEDPPAREHYLRLGNRQLPCHRLRDHCPDLLGSVTGGVPHHQGDARGVAAEIDRREGGIGHLQAQIAELEAEDLRDHRRQYRVGALTDFGLTAEDGDAASTIDVQRDARLRHVVPVDRQSCAAEVAAAGEAEAAPWGELAPALAVARARDHRLDAARESDRPQLQPVGGDGVRLFDHAQSQVRRVLAELDGDLVELDLETEARLRRAVAALRAAGRLVGEGADRLELVVRQAVGHRLQGAGVVGRGDAVAAVGAAVEGRLQGLRGERAVLADAGLHPHQHRMAAAVAVEDLLAGERDLRRPAELQGHRRADDLVAERIALAAEAAAVGRRHDTNARGREAQHLGQCAVKVMRRLRGRPDGDPAVVLGQCHRRVLLHRQVGVAVVEEGVLEDPVGLGEAGLDVAELHRQELVEVAVVGIGVDLRRGGGERLLDRRDCRQRVVLDHHCERRLVRQIFGNGSDRRDRVADMAHEV